MGRIFGLFVGSVFVLGAILEGTSACHNGLPQFYVGRILRILLGFGSNIALSAGPTYVVEIAHPKYRGVLTALQSGTQNMGEPGVCCSQSSKRVNSKGVYSTKTRFGCHQ